ncbi:MAG: DUF2231 domain-containing protein, partial [Armatimonadota bacterium]
MKALKWSLVLGMIGLSLTAQATPEFLKKFKEVYSQPNAQCITCHTAPPERNAFGKEVFVALEKAKTGELTAEILKSVETGDADNDGVSNGDEIKAGTLPGDPTSKPVPSAKPVVAKSSALDNLVPKHTFHPAIVHFPLALIAIAAFLEFLSRWKKNDGFHSASVINLAIGLISAAGAITTGIVAWLRLGHRLEGNLLIHLILASTSILVGVGAYTQRSKASYIW